MKTFIRLAKWYLWYVPKYPSYRFTWLDKFIYKYDQ